MSVHIDNQVAFPLLLGIKSFWPIFLVTQAKKVLSLFLLYMDERVGDLKTTPIGPA